MSSTAALTPRCARIGLALIGLLPSLDRGRAQGQTVPDSTGPWVHESWTVRDGLPVNAVGTLLQSQDGYLWAATRDGLVRYDGVRFTVFNSSIARSLPTNRFITGLEAPDGTLWFRTEDYRLVRYRNGRFTHFDRSRGVSRVAALGLDSTGQVWVGGDDAGMIQGDRVQPVAPDTIRTAWSFTRRRDGTTWIGTGYGEVYRVGSGPTRPVVRQALKDSSIVWSLLEDPAGALWIGTTAGLFVEQNDSVRRVDPQDRRPVNVNQLVWSAARRTVYAYTSSGVYRVRNARLEPVDIRPLPIQAAPPITVDRTGVVWHAAGPDLLRDGRRIYTLSPRPGSASAPAITSLLIDREGGVWMATTQGLDRIKPAIFRTFSVTEGLAGRNVYPVYADRLNRVWAGTWDGGLSRIDPDGRITTYPLGPSAVNVNTLAADSAGRMWVIGSYPYSVCEPSSPRCAIARSHPRGVGIQYALYHDRAGHLWAGGESGIVRQDGGQWHRVPGWQGTSPVRVFLETQDSALWVGTNGDGIARWDGSRFVPITAADGLPSDLVRSLYQDADGTLWVGTEGRGLAALDPLAWKEKSGREDRRIVRIGAEHGLYDETIHQILEDQAGRFWMNTNRGVFWVSHAQLRDFVAGRISRIHSTSYTERDGLKNREGNGGFYPAGARTSDGRLWFPTQDGVVMIDPSRLTPAVLPPAVVERIVAGDSTFVAGDGLATLGVDQRNLQIEYTASSFVEPGNVRFRYRLEPYDPDWIDAGNRRTAFYTRVPPGPYRFRVQVGSSTGEWNEAGESTLELGLAARFWETAWFRWGLALAFGVSLLLAVRWRVAQLRHRARQLELIVAERTRQLSVQNAQLERQAAQLAELDRAKTRFFANVSHEFRTPLTLTIGPLEDLRSRSANDPEGSRWLDLALRNARRLLRLVNQILDVAKLEAGQMKLARRRFDLVPFTRGVIAAFEPVALQRRIDLGVTTPESLVGSFDPDALEKILTNLLSNALKFTPSDGRVTVTLNTDALQVVMAVADSGPGIPAHQLPFVFERFYQADESANRSEPGTGIGLSLVKELVELHQGTIHVDSGNGAPGTTFTVTLPLEDGAGTALSFTPTEIPIRAAAEPGIVEATSREPRSDDDTPTLLVVDDSEDLRVWIREHFANRFRVYEAGDGAEGIALARKHLPDMVISDVMMPGTDGFELCRTLRESPETDFLPIVLLTAQTGSEQRIEGLGRGADDYLTKPFTMRELEARVDNLIALRRRLRERFTRGAAEPPRAPPAELPVGLDPEDQALIERIRAAIEANLADPEFGVAELAKAVFQDRSHLFRRTRELLGATPSDLIRRARIERAARLLETGAGTVTDVAYAVGFNKVSHFCHVFQEAYGATPAAWRARTSER